MKAPLIILWLAAVTFGAFGLAFTIWPGQMAAAVGILLRTPTAQTDFAATYGGLELGMAAFLVWCAMAPERVVTGLIATGCALAGLALVRLAWIAANGGFVAPLMWQLAAIELVAATLAFWGALRAMTAALPRT